MILKVHPHLIEIEKEEPVNEKEINVSKCHFVFDDEIPADVVKEALFTFEGTTYKQIVVNDECDFPSEVLTKSGTVEIGIAPFKVQNEEYDIRYNPRSVYFNTWTGSLKDHVENSEPITPSDKEQIEQNIVNLQNDVEDLEENKQDKLVSGENIKTIYGESVLGTGDIEINVDLSDYYTKEEVDQSQATQNDQINANKGDIESLNGRLTNYSLITETGTQIALNINSSNYQMTAILKDKNGNVIYTSNVIDLPIESMIINATYDDATKEIVFTLQNGNVLRVSVADLVSGLVSTDELNTILGNYYTKSEINTLLQSKANTNDVYTKQEVDTKFDDYVDSDTFTSSQDAQNTNIEENASNIEELQSIVDQLPHEEGEGTDIKLEPTIEAKMSIGEAGSSSQFSTTGKQLFDKSSFNYLDNANVSSSSVINIENNFALIYINLPSGTYTISNDIISYQWLISDCNEVPAIGVSTSPRQVTTDTSVTYTMNSSSYLLIRVAKNTVSITDFVNKLQIEQGSTATSYEPYTNGASPNPDYPQNVKSVTGENSLKIQNKNLFDGARKNTYFNSAGNFANVTNSLTTSFIPAKEGDIFTIYSKTRSNGIVIASFDENYNLLLRSAVIGNEMTHTCPANTRFIIGSNYSGMTTDNQLEKGSSATLYVPHEEQNYQLSLGDIELNSSPDGTIRDVIIGTPDNWVKREYIGKKIITNSEGSSYSSKTNTIRYTYPNILEDKPTLQNNQQFCNYLRYSTSTWAQDIESFQITDKRITFNISKTTVPAGGLNNWLSTNNLIFYYELATPQDIPITDTTLINQLNDIYDNAHSYKGTTNITSTYEDGNEQMYLDASALTDISKKIDTLTNAIIELGGE